MDAVLLYVCFMQSIILASSSPRRKQLREWAEVLFEVVVKSIEEDYPASFFCRCRSFFNAPPLRSVMACN
jgi:hypothetical protein